ncbi:S-adenosyl-L-methionine-dependent methyltransferase [Lipomyces tetrasporus]|uniref:tRNA (adenine(58)-N(1))-methyltransferase catalytic subunit TRM61 n=1 Tax=Lipomyces tetrasporus TaxID=54092 RepID=A0AAD7QY48_9ASCO|nr:S-adenosyl-L-methionine-dependent methyltransferase [Lipomyces tetrasporus]KAJ8103573.1 S-adenosyl-L-methionine-dependent methyltransferase [Lipomyces tetrasporus]
MGGRSAAANVFRPGDVVLLRDVIRPSLAVLSKPLRLPSDTEDRPPSINTHRGEVRHAAILDAHPRTLVKSHTGGATFVATFPTLEEYINFRRRKATPIYSFDAAAIVALADIQVDEREHTVFEFLEAGTGHGSLTLAIARVIHAANANLAENAPRKAVLHSVDSNKEHANYGVKNLREFRRGLYAADVDFHSPTTPSAYLQDRLESLREQDELETSFLSGAFLDLPSPELEMEVVARFLKTDCPLVVFAPSITQIVDVIEAARAKAIPLSICKVVELLPGMGGSMRQWDLRRAVIRNRLDQQAEEGSSDSQYKWVCRPLVGERIVGGGFVAVFRKKLQKTRRDNADELER